MGDGSTWRLTYLAIVFARKFTFSEESQDYSCDCYERCQSANALLYSAVPTCLCQENNKTDDKHWTYWQEKHNKTDGNKKKRP